MATAKGRVDTLVSDGAIRRDNPKVDPTTGLIYQKGIDPKNPNVYYVTDPAMGITNKPAGSPNPAPEGGSGGSGGSYAASTSMPRSEAYFDWMGSYPSASMKAKMESEGWTEDTIRRYAVKNGGTGTLMVKAKNELRQIAAPFYAGDPSGMPDSLLQTLISSGDYADAAYLTNTYFPNLKGASGTNPNSTPFVDSWTEMTGRPLTYTAQLKLNEIVKTYGFTDVGLAAWKSWVKGTESAYTGNYGADKRATITSLFNSLLGRNPTADELSQSSPYWNMADSAGGNALAEAIMQSAEGRTLFAGKPATTSATDWIADLQAKDSVLRWYYGDHVVQGDDGSINIYTGAPDLAQESTQVTGVPEIPDYQAPAVAPLWKSLSVATFVSELSKYGVTAKGSGGDASKYTYTDSTGKALSYDNLLSAVPSDVFYKDATGYHYVQDQGAIDPRTGLAATVVRPPTAASSTNNATANPFTNLGLKYMTPEMAAALQNVSAETLQQQFAWTEEAAYMEGTYGKMLAETGMGGVDFYTVASGAKGSGAMRAQIQQAQNMYAFKEAWRNYFGTDPSASDYQTVSSTYVSPTEFTHRMAAKESAKAKLPQINELLGRTLDHQVTLADLENLAMGGAGSGEIQAMIDQASRLDAFTDTLYQWKGRELTADDYAEVAGFPSAAAFKWEITVSETMDEMRDDINEAMVKSGGAAFSDEQLKIMLGKSEGWGELQAQYNKAEEEVSEADNARKTAMNIEKIAPIYNMASQGGFKQGLQGLADIGGV
jgi:hypothetical protein